MARSRSWKRSKTPRRAHYIFKILLLTWSRHIWSEHPGEKDNTNVDRAAWISTFEEALAKAIVQIVLSRQAEQASRDGRLPKRIESQPQAAFLARAWRVEIRIPTPEGVLPLQQNESTSSSGCSWHAMGTWRLPKNHPNMLELGFRKPCRPSRSFSFHQP